MSERTTYAHGTPSYVDHSSQDVDGAVAFYKGLFGWEAENVMPEDQGSYFMCRKNGKTVAAIGGAQDETPPPAGRHTSRSTTRTRPPPRCRGPAARS